MIGPMIKPMLETSVQRKTSHMRSLALNRSTMLPATTTVGIADKKPVMKRPITIPANDGTAATGMQKMLYRPVLMM